MTERFDPEYTDRLFREGLEGYSETPHSHVWQALRQNIPTRKRFPIMRWAAAIAVLASFGAGMYTQSYLSKPNTNSALAASQVNKVQQASALAPASNQATVSSKNSLSNNNITKSLNAQHSTYTSTVNSPSTVTAEPSVSAKNIYPTTSLYSNSIPSVTPVSSPYEETISYSPTINDNVIPAANLEQIPSEGYASIYTSLPDISPSAGTYPPVIPSTAKQPFHPHLYVGSNAGFNNVNLIDKKNLHNTYQFQFMQTTGSSYGVQAGFAFARHWDLELRYTIHSWQGQRYAYRVNEKYMPEREIRLDYRYLPILFKYHTHITGNTDFVALGGIEYGKYRKSDAYEYNVETSQISNFRPTDIASMAGFGLDVNLNRWVKLGVYGMASYGSDLGAVTLLPTSTNSGSTTPPVQANRTTGNDFQHPHNLLYGLNLALNVRL